MPCTDRCVRGPLRAARGRAADAQRDHPCGPFRSFSSQPRACGGSLCARHLSTVSFRCPPAQENAKHPYFCVLEREDYFECLHMARMVRQDELHGHCALMRSDVALPGVHDSTSFVRAWHALARLAARLSAAAAAAMRVCPAAPSTLTPLAASWSPARRFLSSADARPSMASRWRRTSSARRPSHLHRRSWQRHEASSSRLRQALGRRRRGLPRALLRAPQPAPQSDNARPPARGKDEGRSFLGCRCVIGHGGRGHAGFGDWEGTRGVAVGAARLAR